MPHEFQTLFNHRNATYGSDKNCATCVKGKIIDSVLKESKGKICKWQQVKCIKYPCYYDSRTKTHGTYNTLSFKVCDAYKAIEEETQM